jgi:CubicO group peptidase (beta-lactamase class C family)
MLSDPRIDEALSHARCRGEVGIQVAAFLGGRLIVDCWTGNADPAVSGRMVDGETLFSTFSVTKGVTATALAVLVEQGALTYDTTVAEVWPQYGQAGKAATTIEDVLSHRAGIPAMPAGVTPEMMCDWSYMIGALERAVPIFPPGTTNAYHTLNWGWLVGEIIHRADPKGRLIDVFVREELLTPLGIADIYLGAPDEVLWRVAPVLVPGPRLPAAHPLTEAAAPVSVGPGTVYNRRDVRQAVIPGAGGIMTARAAARLFAMIAMGGELDGARLLSAEIVDSFPVPRSDPEGLDETLQSTVLVSQRGYWLGGPPPYGYPAAGTGRRTICSPGAGGSVVWADLDTGLSAAIFHNMMHQSQMGSHDPEINPLLRLADAIRDVARDHGDAGLEAAVAVLTSKTPTGGI